MSLSSKFASWRSIIFDFGSGNSTVREAANRVTLAAFAAKSFLDRLDVSFFVRASDSIGALLLGVSSSSVVSSSSQKLSSRRVCLTASATVFKYYESFLPEALSFLSLFINLNELGIYSSPLKLICDWSDRVGLPPFLFYLKPRVLQRTAGVLQWGLRGRPVAESIDWVGFRLARGSNAMSMIAWGSIAMLWSSVTSSS